VKRRTDGRTYFDNTYIPFDELIAMPRIRVLRLMRRFDWFSSIDLFDVLRVAEHEIANYNKVLSRLVANGHVDRAGDGIGCYRYRINDRGVDSLRHWMARAQLPDNGSSLSVVAS
jgi:hypothetical protein